MSEMYRRRRRTGRGEKHLERSFQEVSQREISSQSIFATERFEEELFEV